MPNNRASHIARQHFFSKQVYMDVWKDSMAGENEKAVLEILEEWKYIQGFDFERQYPIGDRYVIDIAFPSEKVAIEVDGIQHLSDSQRKKDKERDDFLRFNGWVVVRVLDKKFFKNPTFYKHLLHEVIEERKKTNVRLTDTIYEK
jgi:very-short-patch-repair endonuclease